MKIAIVSTAYPLRGGIAQYTGILYHRLRARGHELRVITFKRQYPGLLFPGKTQLETSRDEQVAIDTEPILDSIGPSTWFKAAGRLRRFKPDLVLIKFWMPFFAPCFGTICWLVKRRLHCKAVYICDNVIPHEKRPGDILLTRYAFRQADSFIVQSKVVERDLLSLFPEASYRLVPHPVYDIFGEILPKRKSRDRLGIKSKRVILFFGYVRKYKGLDLLLQALPEIVRKLDVELLVVGEFYEDEAHYQHMIDITNISGNVKMISRFVPSEEINQYFSAADVVVLPYKSATQSGIVQLAYHFNKPCIVTDVGGLAEVVIDGETGFVVEPENAAAITQAVLRFYEEGKEEAFSQNVQKEKLKYSWDRMLDAIEELASGASANRQR